MGWSYRLASAILGSGTAAAYATQNALVAAWRGCPAARHRAVDPWFRRILVNECRMQLRREWRSREVPLPDDPEGLGRLVGASRALGQVEAVDLLDRVFERLDRTTGSSSSSTTSTTDRSTRSQRPSTCRWAP